MTGGWAATNTLRAAHRDVDAPACNPDCPWCSALSLVEAGLDAAEDIEGRVVSGPDFDLGEVFNSAGRLARALRAVREGK